MTPPDWFQRNIETPSRDFRLEVDGCRIHYVTWGDPAAQPVVLVHGNGAHAEWWRFIAPFLLPEHFIIALDLGGMGDSDRRDRYPRESYVEQVIAVARHAAPAQKPYVIGHSLGGYVTILCAAEYGSELAGAIVIDSPIRPPDMPAQTWRRRSATERKFYSDLEAALERFRLIPAQSCENDFLLRYVARHSLTLMPEGWSWKFDPRASGDLVPRSYLDELTSLACPAAFIWGEQSALFPPQVVDYMRAHVAPYIPVIAIPGAHHHVMLDQPLALAAVLRVQLANWARTNSRKKHKKPATEEMPWSRPPVS